MFIENEFRSWINHKNPIRFSNNRFKTYADEIGF